MGGWPCPPVHYDASAGVPYWMQYAVYLKKSAWWSEAWFPVTDTTLIVDWGHKTWSWVCYLFTPLNPPIAGIVCYQVSCCAIRTPGSRTDQLTDTIVALQVLSNISNWNTPSLQSAGFVAVRRSMQWWKLQLALCVHYRDLSFAYLTVIPKVNLSHAEMNGCSS